MPGETLVIIGGFYASIGDLWLPAVADVPVLGAVLGDNIGFWSRFIPVVRSVAFVLAGVSGMDRRRFIVYDVAGAAIWGVGHSVLGYALGASYQSWEKYLTSAGLGILLVLLLLIGGSKLLAARRRVEEDIVDLEAERSEDR